MRSVIFFSVVLISEIEAVISYQFMKPHILDLFFLSTLPENVRNLYMHFSYLANRNTRPSWEKFNFLKLNFGCFIQRLLADTDT